MEKKTQDKLFMIVTLLLGIVGLALILASVFMEDEPRWVLTAGMAAVALGTILNLFRMRKNNK